MDPTLALKLENLVNAVLECNLQIKNKGIPAENENYTLKMQEQYLEEIKALKEHHPELNHHPALLKIESLLKSK